MSGPPSSMPSWQSQQRMGGGYAPSQNQSPPPSSYRAPPGSGGGGSSGDYGQQQPFPGNAARNRPSTGGGSVSSTGSMQQQMRAIDRSNSYIANGSPRHTPDGMANVPPQSLRQAFPQQGSGTPEEQQPPQPAPQQGQVHRRTQSLRPLSAFQPLENSEGPYASPGQRPPSPTGSTTRSIRTAAAPLTFKSPELRSALGLQDAQSKKIYMEGYLSKRDHLTPDGKALSPTDPKKRWQLCFVQLSGTVLSIWNVHQMEEAARQGTEVPPSYVNITDSFVDFIGTITESPQDVPGSRGRYENVFALNTAGQNRILFGVEGSVGRRLVQAWVNGIRLATWEKVRLEEIYTGSLVRARLGAVSAQQATSGPGGAPGDVDLSIKSPLNKSGRMEGWVKARFMGSTEWRKCWLVLSDRGAESAVGNNGANADQSSDNNSVTNPRNSFWSKLKAGDRSSLIGSPSVPAISDTGLRDIEVPPGNNGATGLACFYETKKAKKPFASLAYASHTFAVYPSRPELVEGSSLFKVEGAFPLSGVVSATNRIRQSGWVMIMPELDSASNKGANAEMMKWCIAFMDAFKLYGRPSQFQWDARNPASPFFAYPIGPYKDRLFLDRELSEFLDIREERHLANRHNLHGIMSARMRGERTPVLPPLPQPNVDSTRGLNGPAGQQQQQVQEQQQRPPQSQGQSQALRSELPPLNIGSEDSDFSQQQLQQRGTQLSSIGERSREGSVMTNFTQTPLTAAPTDDVAKAQESLPSAPSQQTQSGLSNGEQSQADTISGLPSNGTLSTSTDTVSPLAKNSSNNAQRSQGSAGSGPRLESEPATGAGAYDEGVLYYLNSIGDSLPAVTPNVSTAKQNIAAKDRPANEDSTTMNAPSATAPLQVANKDGLQKATEKAQPLTPPAVDGLDSDARAAYSFLDRPPSPSPAVPSSKDTRSAPSGAGGNGIVAPAAAGAAYPSSFSSNKTNERKLAAQAQAQAHSEAMAKPGHAAGAAKNRIAQGGRRTYNEEEDDEEDEEEEGDDDAYDGMEHRAQQGRAAPSVPVPASVARQGVSPQPPAHQYAQQQPPQRHTSPYNGAHLTPRAPGLSNAVDSRGSSPGGSFDSGVPRSNTLVQLSREEHPGAISMAFQPHGLLQAGAQDKAERSAKHLEADARATGGHFVNVDSKPPPPQAGLVGAITAHERDRRKEGGLGATLTERERERAQAERRQREEDAMRTLQQQQMQQQQQQQQQMMMGSPSQMGGQQGQWPTPAGMSGFNPMMWQQMQMMMMNPMMFGGGQPPAHMMGGGASQSGHGHQNSAFSMNDMQQQQQAAQMRAAQAAQQAYMQAMQQQAGLSSPAPQMQQSTSSTGQDGSFGGSGPASPSMPPMSMGMMPFNPYMSMYGAPMGFPGPWAGPMGAGNAGTAGQDGSGSGFVTSSPAPAMGSPEPPRSRQPIESPIRR